MNFTLTLRSSLLPYISVCVCVCVRKPTAAKETTAQKITQSSPAVSESHHWNLSTSIILAPGLLRRFETSPWKGLLAQRSPPSSPVSASSAYAGGYFGVFNSFGMNAEMSYPCMSDLSGKERFVWSVLIYGWLQYAAIQIMRRALILKSTPIHSNWQLKCLIARHKQTQKITATVPN